MKISQLQQIFAYMGISLAIPAGMLFFAGPVQAQQPPPDLVCEPLPEAFETFEQCVYYFGLNNIDNVDDGNPATNMPSTRPANCDPLPEDQATLEACIYFMGLENNQIYANTTPQTPPPAAPNNPPGPGAVDTPVDTTWLGTLISQIYLWSLGVAASLAVAVSVLGGYLVMTARGNAAQAAKGKSYILSAVAGMVLLFGAFIILNTINPDLVNFSVEADLGPAGTP